MKESIAVAARATKQLTVCTSLLQQCHYCRSLHSRMIKRIHIQRKMFDLLMFLRVLLLYEVRNQRGALNKVPARRGVADDKWHGNYSSETQWSSILK